MKTAVTVLQEMMVKLGLTPEYECIAQSGPQHQAMFEYRCKACGVVVTASARSKKEAKQEVARLMLQQLSARGHPVPPPYAALQAHSDHMSCGGGGGGGAVGGGGGDVRSYVALLKELCEEYRLAGVQYELVGDTGPPHLRHFTVRARIGHHERFATSTTKKAARQLAAEKLYQYLRENLARVTKDFNEEDALMRAHERAMDRYMDVGSEDMPRRPDLGQKIADYHLGITARLDEESRSAALAALQSSSEEAESALQHAAAALSVTLEWGTLQGHEGGDKHVLHVLGAEPDLAFGDQHRAAAARQAADYIRDALKYNPHPQTDLLLST